jgi:hypothetical protein
VLKHDHDAVLNLWAEGFTAQDIGRRTKMMPEYVRTIVIRARNSGDSRAKNRPRGGINRFSLSTSAHKNFATEAARRDISELELASMVLEAVSEGKLFGAVIDD